MELDINLSKPSIGPWARDESCIQSDGPFYAPFLGVLVILVPRFTLRRSRRPNGFDNMKKLKFKVKLEGVPGMDTAALSAPFDVEEVFGTRARVPVRGTINGFPYRSSLMPMDGCHRMVVNREIRAGAGVKAGDTVTVEMERDDVQRTVSPPPQLNKELTKSKTARANWEKLSFTNKKEMARSILEVKQEETRARRLAKVMDVLKNRKKWTG
jgi:hypothetical protein